MKSVQKSGAVSLPFALFGGIFPYCRFGGFSSIESLLWALWFLCQFGIIWQCVGMLTAGAKAPHYKKLTSLLHWKPDSISITHEELDDIYKALFPATVGSYPKPSDNIASSEVAMAE